jgi:hypothetical protein
MKHTFPREFCIPKDARKETREGVNAEAYLYEKPDGKPCGMGFIAKQSKPAFHYVYRSEDSRREAIDRFFDGIKASQEYKEKRQATRREFVTSLKVGDLLHGSWGYDQTNPEFAEVVDVTGPRSIVIRSIGMKGVDGYGYNGMAEDVVPVPGNYVGPPVRKIVMPGDCVKINEHCTASKTTADSKHYHSWYA